MAITFEPETLESQRLKRLKNLTKILPPCGWGQGPNEFGQKAQTYPTYDVTHRKPETQNLNYFSLQTRRLTKSFEGFNSSLAQSPGELWSCSCKDLPNMGKL